MAYTIIYVEKTYRRLFMIKRKGLASVLFKSVLAAVMILAITGIGFALPRYEDGKTYELTVLHTNDHHGTILPNDGQGGLAERATFIKSVRAKGGNLLVLDAGDINTGTALANMFKAEVDINAYNMIGYDAVALGNHEFDTDLPTLERQIVQAKFPWLSANIKRPNGEYLDKAYIIKDFEGFRVGIFGLTTLRTLKIASPDKSLVFEDEIVAARRMVDILRNRERSDLVILVGHLGLVEEETGQITSVKLAQAVKGIDLIIDGHSHTFLDKPQYAGTTPIVSANEWGKYVGWKVQIVNGNPFL